MRGNLVPERGNSSHESAQIFVQSNQARSIVLLRVIAMRQAFRSPTNRAGLLMTPNSHARGKDFRALPCSRAQKTADDHRFAKPRL
jgi:hypothetical protein